MPETVRDHIHYDLAAIERQMREAGMGTDRQQDHPDPSVRAQGRAGDVTVALAMWVLREQNGGLDPADLFRAASGIVSSFLFNLLQIVDEQDRPRAAEMILNSAYRSFHSGDSFIEAVVHFEGQRGGRA